MQLPEEAAGSHEIEVGREGAALEGDDARSHRKCRVCCGCGEGFMGRGGVEVGGQRRSEAVVWAVAAEGSGDDTCMHGGDAALGRMVQESGVLHMRIAHASIAS
jgi:hypothetical protein